MDDQKKQKIENHEHHWIFLRQEERESYSKKVDIFYCSLFETGTPENVDHLLI